jgi:hypothetical protein
MLIWERKIPFFLVKKESIVSTTIFTGLFALAFINIYSPFELERWYQASKLQLFIYTSLAVLTGMAVIIVSRILIYYFSKRHHLTYIQYSFWVFAEISSMAIGYALFIKYFMDDSRGIVDLIKLMIKNTALVLLLPYSALWLYFSYREKTRQLEKISEGKPNAINPDKMFPFYDEKGKLKFSVLVDDILYLEASDNYVSIYYSSGNKIVKYMVRNTLKNLEKKMSKFGFIRSHRSYLINFNKVKILKRSKDGLVIELNTDPITTLPVSKTYISNVIESLSEFSNI